MSLDDRLTQLEQYNMGIDIISEKPFTPKDHHAVYPELKTTQQAILTDLLELIGEDVELNENHVDAEWGDGYSCVVCEKNYRQNQLRQELRDKVREYCE